MVKITILLKTGMGGPLADTYMAEHACWELHVFPNNISIVDSTGKVYENLRMIKYFVK